MLSGGHCAAADSHVSHFFRHDVVKTPFVPATVISSQSVTLADEGARLRRLTRLVFAAIWIVPGTLAGYTPYLARWADLELHRAAVAAVLAMQRERIAPAQRAAWLRAKPVTEGWRDRATLSADGAQLTLRTWQSEVSSGGFNAARDGIAISWPQ